LPKTHSIFSTIPEKPLPVYLSKTKPLGVRPTDWRYVFVADFEALPCQVTRKFIRCWNAETRTISAI